MQIVMRQPCTTPEVFATTEGGLVLAGGAGAVVVPCPGKLAGGSGGHEDGAFAISPGVACRTGVGGVDDSLGCFAAAAKARLA